MPRSARTRRPAPPHGAATDLGGLTRRTLLAGAGAAWVAARAGALEAAPPRPPEAPSGPMVGHTTHASASLWASAGVGAQLEVAWRPEGAPRSEAKRVRMVPDATNAAVQRTTIEGLAPSTRYFYRLSWGGASRAEWTGAFRTARAPGTPGITRIGTSSCMKPSFPGTSFAHLKAEAPDLHLLLGDNAYHDSTRREVIWAEHRAMRAVPELAALLRHVPTYAIWDDHDFGGDDTDGGKDGKHRSLACFRELFANPSYGLPDEAGIFTRFSWGDVDVFLLDVRFHRCPNKAADGPEKRMLGPRQMAWLADGLAESKAVFKVVASGSVLDADERDTWRDFPSDRARLFRILSERRVGGVVFATGDLHYCKVQVHAPERTGTYGVPEVISSGIANSHDLGFAVLEADTTQADPVLSVRLMDKARTVRHEQRFLRSALEPRAADGGQAPGGG